MRLAARSNSYSLQTQLILGFAAIAVLTAAAVGIPAVFYLVRQLEQQAWEQVESGRNATLAILLSRQNELDQLATLTAHRPTLEELVSTQQYTALAAYIQTLQANAEVNLILVCDLQSRSLVPSSPADLSALCKSQTSGGIYLDPITPGVWMLSAQSFPRTGNALGRVILGQRLDQAALAQLGGQTGLEQILVQEDRILAASFPDTATFTAQAAPARPAAPSPDSAFPGGISLIINIDNAAYYGMRMPYGVPGLELIVALPIRELLEKQAQYRYYLAASIALAALAGTLLGFLLARGISRPLKRVGKAANSLREGDLDTPIPMDIRINEVYQVARTLENTRTALQHTLQAYDQQRAWTEHLLESIVEGIVTLNHLGRVTFFSQGAERITGLTQVDALGRRCDDIFFPAQENTRFSDFIPPPGGRSKVVLRLSDERLVTLSISGAKLTKTSKDRVALVLRDVSDEEGLRRLLGDFLANITHEFRTPLSALAASVELLHDQLSDLSVEETGELLDSIHLGVFGLQTLIDNLLEGASIETGQFRVAPRPTPIREIIYESAHLLQPLLQKYGQNLRIDLPADNPVVLADTRRTIQVLVNLLSNAIKNNPEQGEISIMVRVENDFACIDVVDQGPGIPVRHFPNLFTRFMRFEPATARSEAGAGLGLSVVKAIVEAQGGQVAVQNRPERGAIFRFTLPIVEEETYESFGR